MEGSGFVKLMTDPYPYPRGQKHTDPDPDPDPQHCILQTAKIPHKVCAWQNFEPGT